MSTGDITALLRAHTSGDSEALDELFPLVYDGLQRIAHQRLRGERNDHTLQTTALVHEAYLELVKVEQVSWQNRQHFFAMASRIMRNVLVDYAVKRKAQKRGGDNDVLSLQQGDAVATVDLDGVLSVHQALERLEEVDERQVRVVECRFFGGLTIQETADALDISPATVGRDWKMARAWLNRELSNGARTERGG
ncbi:RNA polymerase subunit sigma-70 [Longimonas halophila]|uniref:RNA polymerase subunit sigma-70 n=1 Tax=Longimonas halophila TaxID=1469170 RepID=A0A2H3NPL1_9BACT|nr:sigma-70 family RNA polymerase sigma factor [Longimonas halophila]PEN08805.1 RNA polymerase subunit sigma-70 [Longimonas halophila]